MIQPSNRFSRYTNPSLDRLIRDLQDYERENDARFEALQKTIDEQAEKIKALGG